MSETIQDLARWCLERITENPGITQEINELYILCTDEIEDENVSIQNEIDLCKQEVEALVQVHIRTFPDVNRR